MIDTLIQSTEAYLALLERTRGGLQRHDVKHIKLSPAELIENETWPVITCRLQPKLKFPQDVAATLVATGHPRHEIPAQIVKYNPKSGRARIAVKEEPRATEGKLIIDFKWLIKRLLQWLQKHGANVGNPFAAVANPPIGREFKKIRAMSDEQIKSAENLLENRVAYVWGPPGTGKTRFVLARTVAHLIRQGQRVLVTAATNLAVDNALDAILSVRGVKRDSVLRLGVPSDEFRCKWPECCEQRAFEAEKARLQSELESIGARQEATRRRAELKKRLLSLLAGKNAGETPVPAEEPENCSKANFKAEQNAATTTDASENAKDLRPERASTLEPLDLDKMNEARRWLRKDNGGDDEPGSCSLNASPIQDIGQQVPPDEIKFAISKLAMAIQDAGHQTPEQVAAYLEATEGGLFRPYSRSIWRAMGALKSGDDAAAWKDVNQAKWARIYKKILHLKHFTSAEEESTSEEFDPADSKFEPTDSKDEESKEYSEFVHHHDSQPPSDLDLAEFEIVRLTQECDRASAELAELELLLGALRDQLSRAHRDIDALGLEDKNQDILNLQDKYTQLLRALKKVDFQVSELGWRQRFFPSRKKQILAQRQQEATVELATVAAILHSKKTSYDQVLGEGQALESTIAELKRELSAQVQTRSELAALLARNGEAIRELEAIRDELRQIAEMDLLPADEDAMAALKAEYERVQIAMTQIAQHLSDKQVLGMTLDGFIGLTMNESLHFDHVIVDEAGYAPLAKVIPLCSLHCPISLLGDHRQLPPVYEGKNHVKSKCYWGTSALYLEDAFEPEIGTSFTALLGRSKKPPRFVKLSKSELRHSYRFGETLAALLDRHFYEIGLHSRAPVQTSIDVIGCGPVVSPQRKKRENYGERDAIVQAVREWLNQHEDGPRTLAVLSPYVAQVKLLQDALSHHFGNHPAYYLVDVSTVHKAQGREWDTVFFSASDTTRLQDNGPWFSDTSRTEGSLLVNTAISRAKTRLRIFFDVEDWARRQTPESFLSEIAMNPEFSD